MAAKKKRGGQPGNLNAYQHGFYSEHFDRQEIRDLDTYLTNGLGDEIQLMRVTAKRLMGMAKEAPTIDDQISILNAVGMAATRLAGLLRIRKIIGSDDRETTNAVSDALNQALEEWNRK